MKRRDWRDEFREVTVRLGKKVSYTWGAEE
jgi:hypothetical protein